MNKQEKTMHKTEAKIGDKVIILRDRWENILLDRNELPIIMVQS